MNLIEKSLEDAEHLECLYCSEGIEEIERFRQSHRCDWFCDEDTEQQSRFLIAYL